MHTPIHDSGAAAQGARLARGGGERSAYTIADIACWGYAAQYWWAGITVASFPSVRAWIDRVASRPHILTGVATPGVSVLGEGGATFAQFLSDAELRDKIVASAEARCELLWVA